MKNLVVIPARAGSKGIKNKNVAPLGSKPLVTWTLESCSELDKRYEVIISSNMNEVKEIAKKFNFNCDYIRPDYLSEDDTSMYETVFDLINWYEEVYDDNVEKIILLQPSNPLRLREDIDKFIKKLDEGCESCFSVVPALQSPYELIEFEEKKWHFLRKDENAIRRQDYKSDYWFIDGSIYGCTKKFLFQNKSFVKEDISYPIKCAKNSSWDIDTPFDLAVAECMLISLKNKVNS